jgi:stage III sporulation protein AD
MDVFLKAMGMALVCAVLGLVLTKQCRDMGVLLTLCGCVMLAVVMLGLLEPVLRFCRRIAEMTKLDSDMVGIVFKAVGIAMVGELAACVCVDAGNSALGKTVELLTAAVVLWLSIPLLESVLELISTVLAEV